MLRLIVSFLFVCIFICGGEATNVHGRTVQLVEELGTLLPDSVPSSIRSALKELYELAGRQSSQTAKKVVSSQDAVDQLALGLTAHPIRRLATGLRKEAFAVSDAIAVVELPYEEQRHLGLLLLQQHFERAGDVVKSLPKRDPTRATSKRLRSDIVAEVASRIQSHFNTDRLIEVAGPRFLGEHVAEQPSQWSRLQQLAQSTNIWDRKAAMHATYHVMERNFLQNQVPQPTYTKNWHKLLESRPRKKKPLIQPEEFYDVAAVIEALAQSPEVSLQIALGQMLQKAGVMDQNFLIKILDRDVDLLSSVTLKKATYKLGEQLQMWYKEHRKDLLDPGRLPREFFSSEACTKVRPVPVKTKK